MADKTTPGLFYPFYSDGAWSVIAAVDGHKVAEIKTIDPTEAEANAALLAGSKDMVEMLNRCEWWLSTHPEGKAMRDSVRGTLAKVGLGPCIKPIPKDN